MAVIVPAADEEQTIGDCLSAVLAARAHLHRATGIAVRIVVALDSCRDQTARIARQIAEPELVAMNVRNVGAARAAGARHALTGSGPPSETWLASTDADSRVPVTWLSHMLAEARSGAHLVLGTVIPEPGLQHLVHRAWLSRHHLRDGHPHVHGANLGIRGDAYLALGGWPEWRAGEDVELARRATTTGHLRISRTAAIPVHTSIRQAGRAPRGFSSYLGGLVPVTS
jgi:cellulose synthase/poly-beta-1,6-N-acetylglucosamine synthase-like glycosyltransferase